MSTLQDILEAEHHTIDDGILRYVEGLRSDSTDSSDLTAALALLRRHIYLEEEFLFDAVKEAGLAMPVFVMLKEHGELWRAMDALTEQVRSDAEPDDLVAACQNLLSALEKHNLKEEPLIYPHADTVLTDEEATTLRDFLDSGSLPDQWICQYADD
ncbi:MAG: hemerythrin domain-containing protein [Ornithinimicrobium sp.]|uniref:hemerythrin domain-containing protein n=1 Tax=Ornithinimicrobium sp. TaxID=1977084 RepID=UPI0026E06907|nr:hemerythrin domain-containing protein [Ornithinimicrobium sp.]MDO5739746.1 hemerythrin domain-containing protein [Ornithinimicrobium sp.]